MEGETDQESEEVAERETEKNESESGRRGRAGDCLDIDTYPAIKLMNLIRPD